MPFFEPKDMQPNEPVPGCRMRTPFGEKLMLSYLEMDDGAEIPLHDHPHEQGGILLEGKLELTIGDDTRIMEPGCMYLVPPNVPHKAVAVDGPVVVLDVFTPIREEARTLRSDARDRSGTRDEVRARMTEIRDRHDALRARVDTLRSPLQARFEQAVPPLQRQNPNRAMRVDGRRGARIANRRPDGRTLQGARRPRGGIVPMAGARRDGTRMRPSNRAFQGLRGPRGRRAWRPAPPRPPPRARSRPARPRWRDRAGRDPGSRTCPLPRRAPAARSRPASPSRPRPPPSR